jgi:hypothetical protein
MLETISVDTKTMVIKSDNDADFSEIINFVVQKNRKKDVADFLRFAAKNRITDAEFKFNRNSVYAGEIKNRSCYE